MATAQKTVYSVTGDGNVSGPVQAQSNMLRISYGGLTFNGSVVFSVYEGSGEPTTTSGGDWSVKETQSVEGGFKYDIGSYNYYTLTVSGSSSPDYKLTVQNATNDNT